MILDIGGGPGRYTIELAKRGYEMILFDISSECLRFAEEKIQEEGVEDRVKRIVEGTATDLSAFQDNQFDAVLLMGPLYHLIEKEDQVKTIKETIRVSKK